MKLAASGNKKHIIAKCKCPACEKIVELSAGTKFTNNKHETIFWFKISRKKPVLSCPSCGVELCMSPKLYFYVSLFVFDLAHI